METVIATVDPVLYLYGIVPSALTFPSIEGVEPGSAVFLVESGNLACAASVVSAGAYDHPHQGDSAAQAEWISRRAWRHHEVLCALHAAGTVLPLKFGSISPAAADVRTMLEDLRVPVTDLLAKHVNKDEWTLKMSADAARLSARLQRTSPALIALREAEAALADGRSYFARKKLMKATSELVDEHLAALEDCVMRRLEPLAAAIARACRRTAASAPAGAGVVAAAALLIDRGAFDSVNGALAELEAEHAQDALTFELVGPCPPYSFSTTIDRARS